MPSCGFVAQVVSAVVAAVVALYLGPQTSLAVFDPWRADGPFSFKTPHWRPHTPVSTPGIHLPFPPNDTAPVPSIPYATPYFTLEEVEKLVAIAYLNGSNFAASSAASDSSVAFAATTDHHLAAPGSWLLPSVYAVASAILRFYGKLAWHALIIVAYLLAVNVVWCRHLARENVVLTEPARPSLPFVATISTSDRETQTDLLFTTNSSTSTPAWPSMDTGTQTTAPIMAMSGFSSMEILPSSLSPAPAPARPTSDSAMQTSPAPASTPARPTSEAGTQYSPHTSANASSLALSEISSFELLPSSPPSPPATRAPARPSSDAGSQTSPRPPPTRPNFNPGANNFVPNSGPGGFVPHFGGRGGHGNFPGGGAPPPFGGRGRGGFVPPFRGRGGAAGGFVPPFRGGFHGGIPPFPGDAPQFGGRGGFPSPAAPPFVPAAGGTFPSAAPPPGSPGSAPVVAFSQADWDAWNARFPQHGKQVIR